MHYKVGCISIWGIRSLVKGGIEGLIEISRISGIPVQDLSRLSPGLQFLPYRLTNL